MNQTTPQLVDRAHAVARPDGVGQTHKELELDERAVEQEPLFAAEGEHAASEALIAVAGLSLACRRHAGATIVDHFDDAGLRPAGRGMTPRLTLCKS